MAHRFVDLLLDVLANGFRDFNILALNYKFHLYDLASEFQIS
jgi:hypothetical protein